MDSQQAHEQMLNITNHQGNTTQNHNEMVWGIQDGEVGAYALYEHNDSTPTPTFRAIPPEKELRTN